MAETAMALLALSALNGLSYGLLLFLLSAGLTLVFSLLGVLNFAHASFYMLGAYLGCSLARLVGFWPALLLAPLAIGVLGAAFERSCLRRVHRFGHVPELLVTFGLSYVILEVVQLAWGRGPLDFQPPALLRGPAFTLLHDAAGGLRWVWGAAAPSTCNVAAGAAAGGLTGAGAASGTGAGAVLAAVGGATGAAPTRAFDTVCSPFPASRGFIMVVALAVWLALWALLSGTRIGLVIRAALTHRQAVEALGHDVPRVFTGVFGVGAGLAALAGVVGGSTFVTEPAMAASVGSVVFVVAVVGGLGSLAGAFVASLLIGLLQTFAVALDRPLGSVWHALGLPGADAAIAHAALSTLTLSQVAPILPYLLLVLVLVLRPQGLLGTRAGTREG